MQCNASFSLGSIENFNVFKTNPKLLKRLKINDSEDNFYEAHQLYKTIHFRCTTAKDFKEARDVIFNGILFFYTKKSDNVYYCSDLSKTFIETLKKFDNQTPDLIDSDLLSKIKLIHLALQRGHEERNEFVCTILKWSGSLFNSNKNKPSAEFNHEQNLITYQKSFGHVGIHREIALNFWQEENYVQARYHFLHSIDGESCAKMLIECHMNYGYPSEVDLFLTQNVLQYLCLRNLVTAKEFYEQYIRNHPLIKENITKLPLINFIKFLFIAINKNQVKWFKCLCEVYKQSLDVDASYGDYLERIGQYFFNIKAKKVEAGGSIFNNLFKMLAANPGEMHGSTSAASHREQSGDESDYLEDNDLLD